MNDLTTFSSENCFVSDNVTESIDSCRKDDSSVFFDVIGTISAGTYIVRLANVGTNVASGSGSISARSLFKSTIDYTGTARSVTLSKASSYDSNTGTVTIDPKNEILQATYELNFTVTKAVAYNDTIYIQFPTDKYNRYVAPYWISDIKDPDTDNKRFIPCSMTFKLDGKDKYPVVTRCTAKNYRVYLWRDDHNDFKKDTEVSLKLFQVQNAPAGTHSVELYVTDGTPSKIKHKSTFSVTTVAAAK